MLHVHSVHVKPTLTVLSDALRCQHWSFDKVSAYTHTVVYDIITDLSLLQYLRSRVPHIGKSPPSLILVLT